MLQVDAGFGESGRTGRIEPEGGIIFTGRLGLEAGRVLLDQAGEALCVFVCRGGLRPAHHDDVLQIAQFLPALQLGVKRFADHCHPRPRIVKDVVIVRCLEQRVDRNRDGPNLDGAEKTDSELGSVEQKQEDSFLDPDPELAQTISEAVYALP
jgi:hypothetical protein